MKTILSILLVVIVLAMSIIAFAENEKSFTYIGNSKCVMCHKGAAKGNIYEDWQKTKHANAFATLGTEEAAAVMKKLGREGSAQEDKECLSCHISSTEFKTEGVNCESCHGPGSAYKTTHSKDKKLAIENGFVEKPKEHCVVCHNEKSPTFKGFNLDEWYPKIEHHSKPKQ
ncbi:MAG: cytochrome c family protein [bacterium]|nr:cytochrome c family protein [bacterium]